MGPPQSVANITIGLDPCHDSLRSFDFNGALPGKEPINLGCLESRTPFRNRNLDSILWLGLPLHEDKYSSAPLSWTRLPKNDGGSDSAKTCRIIISLPADVHCAACLWGQCIVTEPHQVGASQHILEIFLSSWEQSAKAMVSGRTPAFDQSYLMDTQPLTPQSSLQLILEDNKRVSERREYYGCSTTNHLSHVKGTVLCTLWDAVDCPGEAQSRFARPPSLSSERLPRGFQV